MVRKPLTSQEAQEMKGRFLNALDGYLNSREVNGWYQTVNTEGQMKAAREALGQVFVEALLLD